MQAALPLPVLGGLCFCCTVENWFLLIATVARLHQHSELVRVRSTAWEREEYLKATEESSHEKVSWLLPNDHVTLMADQCLTCKEKVCISARNIHFTQQLSYVVSLVSQIGKMFTKIFLCRWCSDKLRPVRAIAPRSCWQRATRVWRWNFLAIFL